MDVMSLFTMVPLAEFLVMIQNLLDPYLENVLAYQ